MVAFRATLGKPLGSVTQQDRGVLEHLQDGTRETGVAEEHGQRNQHNHQCIFNDRLTLIIEQVRDVVIWGKPPNLFYLSIYTIFAYVIAWLGLAWFQKMRRGFADVL